VVNGTLVLSKINEIFTKRSMSSFFRKGTLEEGQNAGMHAALLNLLSHHGNFSKKMWERLRAVEMGSQVHWPIGDEEGMWGAFRLMGQTLFSIGFCVNPISPISIKR
jgi:hypothetical protein